MIAYTYLTCLVIALGGLAFIDARLQLVFFSKGGKAVAPLLAIAGAMAFFAVWDLIGIKLNIFFPGQSKFVTGIMMLPRFPLEEVFFLMLLGYNALIVWAWQDRS